MQKLVRDYLNELNRQQKKKRKIGIAVLLLTVLVAGTVVGVLTRYGIAMTGDPKCGIEEHTHTEKCYEDVLVCGLEESEGHTHTEDCYETESVLTCGLEESEPTEESEGHTHTEDCYTEEQKLVCAQEESEGHTHTEECYEEQLVCEKEEHTHTEECYIDKNADMEEASVWDQQYANVEWKEAWGEDLVTVAKAQVGYKESTDNYIVAEDDSHKGYTRYGQFAVNAGYEGADVYADWDAAFVNFCLHYAGLEESGMFPAETAAAKWYEEFTKINGGANAAYLTAPEGYEPQEGDIVFMKKENEETAFQMGIVSSYNKEKNEIKVIEGNSGNEVKENQYDAQDEQITAYLKTGELEAAYKDKGENKTSGKEGAAEEEEKSSAYEEKYEDDTIVIHVSAAEGVVPEGAELSVTPIEQKEVTEEMSEEEAAEAEKVNEQYELTNQKLQEESEKKKETLEGFLAYDICFIVDGEEVEPSGDVKVTMDFKEATKPEGVSENAVVAVNHLKEDESAADGIVVEDLTEKDDTTIATAEADASVEKVEVVADTFSTFIIKWIFGDDEWENAYSPQMQIEYVDSEGNELPYDGENIEITINKHSAVNLQTSFPKVIKVGDDSYTRQDVKVIKKSTKEGHSVVSVKVEKMDQFEMAEAIFCDSGQNEYSYSVQEISDGDVVLQLVYGQAVGADGIEIVDDIVQSGNIKAEGGDSIISQPSYKGKTFKYVWYKQINNGPYVSVGAIIYENGMANINDNGKSLNVALDKGALNSEQQSVNYKVELQIYDDDGNVIHSVESDPFPITYYSEVQNGGFENPPLNPDTSKFVWVSEEKVDGWRTTASNHEIEIVTPTKGANEVCSWYDETVIPAAEGAQFAEINGHDFHGALYQDVLTIKDIPLNYYFSHRARRNAGEIKGTNKIYVVIMPTKVAEAGISGWRPTEEDKTITIDTRGEILKVIENQAAYKAYVKEYTSNLSDHLSDPDLDQTGWRHYQDEYTPTDSLTRFFFVSAEDVDPTMGNYLDNVSFGQNLPVPSSDTFNLRIEKTVKNLGRDELIRLRNQLSFKIEVKNSEGNFVEDSTGDSKLLTGGVVNLKASEMTWVPNADGSFTGTYDYKNNHISGTYKISVTETGEDLTGYTVTATSGNTVTSLGGNPVRGEGSTDIAVSSKQAVEVAFDNAYKAKSVKVKDISFTKIWEDFNDAYGIRPEKLQIKLIGRVNGKVLTDEELAGLNVDVSSLSLEITDNPDSEKAWKHTWKNIPVYADNEEKVPIDWSVEELLTENDQKWYTQKVTVQPEKTVSFLETKDSSAEGNKIESLSITNALNNNDLRDWKMVKHSTSGGRDIRLQGAMFELKKDTQSLSEAEETNLVATGVSKEDGIIDWSPKDSSKDWATVKSELNGEYIIRETMAPAGYSVKNAEWKIEFVNGIPNISGNQPNIAKDTTTGKIIFYIGNDALYSLPEAGGSGIYWYMFSGILLMAVAALMTYKKRCREVLKG